MSRVALIVEYETREGSAEVFFELMTHHAERCLAEEPGCLRFEVLQPLNEQGAPIHNKFMASELFADQAALDAHIATERWRALAQRFFELLISRKPTRCRVA